MGVHCTILSTFVYVWTFSLKILGGEEGTWHHGKKMSFRVTEIWIRILTLLSLGPPNIIPELCSSEPVTGRNPQMLVPSFLPSRHQVSSLPLFMNWSVGHPIPELPTASSPFQTRQRTPSNPFSSRIVSKRSLPIFFNYTFFLLKPHGATWKTGKEAVMGK